MADDNEKWPHGPGLYVELTPVGAHLRGLPEEEQMLFKALPTETFNVERWARDTLAEWDIPAPSSDELKQLVADLKQAQDARREPSTMKRVKFDPQRATPPAWLWEDRIYLGGLNLLLGREGIGKGTLACWLITQLVLGNLPGTFQGEPSRVAVIGSEDDFHRVWTPRVIGAAIEAGLTVDEAERVFDSHITRYENAAGGTPSLGEVEEIAKAAYEDEVRLIFFDSLLDSIPGETNVWKDKSTRDALLPAKWLAEELDTAVVGSLHPNKSGSSFDQIVSGARAFNAVSRSSLLLERHPEDEAVRVVLQGKGNYSEKPQALEWDLTGSEFELNDLDFSVPVVKGLRDSSVTEDDLMGQFGGGGKDEERGPTKVERGAALLEAMFADGKPQPAIAGKAALAEEELVSRVTETEAKRRAGIVTFKQGDVWWWKKEDAASEAAV